MIHKITDGMNFIKLKNSMSKSQENENTNWERKTQLIKN